MQKVHAINFMLCFGVLSGCAPGKTTDQIAKACPNGRHDFHERTIATPKHIHEAELDATWRKMAQPARSKLPSDIAVAYRFDKSKPSDTGENEIKLRFQSITSEPAAAYIYAIDGGQLLEHSKSLFVLEINKTHEVSLRIKSENNGGTLAVVTCQQGRQSVMSVDFPKK